MRVYVLIGLLLLSSDARAAAAGPYDFSAVKALAGKTLSEEELVPGGFLKLAEAKGDLDGDGQDDVVLIIHRPAQKATSPGTGLVNPVTHPVLVFRADKSGKYTLWKLGLDHFITVDVYHSEEELTATLAIRKGVLTMESSLTQAGSFWSRCRSKWRNGLAGFQLIGLTAEDDRTEVDTNYLTGVTIRRTDRNTSGDNLDKPTVTRTKEKPYIVLWDEFSNGQWCRTDEPK